MTPSTNESQAEFAIRFHEANMDAIPDTDARTRACFDAWDKSNPHDRLRRMAYDRFGEGFQHVDNVCEFTEHTTKDREGRPTVYDRDALVAVTTRLNHRIADTGDFSPVVEGHTPDDPQGKQPEVLGYAGPFRLGMIGNESPRWAIFADEHHHSEAVDKLKRLRRRSPEVWLEERMEDRFFDPIAALGATTPRLDLGMAPIAYRAEQNTTNGRTWRMSRHTSGKFVAKYSAAFAGPMNTFVSSDNNVRDYAAGEESMDQGQPSAGVQGTLSPEAVAQIVSAVMDTEPMQWVVSQMDSQANAVTSAPEIPPDNADPAAPEASSPPVDAAAAPVPSPDAVAADAPVEDDPTKDMGDDEKKHYSCMPPEQQKSYMAWKKSYAAEAGDVVGELDNQEQGDVEGTLENTDTGTVSDKEKLQRLSREHHAAKENAVDKARYEKQEREIKQLRETVDKMDYEKKYAARTSTLEGLRREGYSMTLEKEVKRCDPAGMTDAQFTSHVECIKENYAKAPINMSVYHGDLSHETRVDDQMREKIASEARDLCLQEQRNGKANYSYEDAHRAVSEKYGRKSQIA